MVDDTWRKISQCLQANPYRLNDPCIRKVQERNGQSVSAPRHFWATAPTTIWTQGHSQISGRRKNKRLKKASILASHIHTNFSKEQLSTIAEVVRFISPHSFSMFTGLHRHGWQLRFYPGYILRAHIAKKKFLSIQFSTSLWEVSHRWKRYHYSCLLWRKTCNLRRKEENRLHYEELFESKLILILSFRKSGQHNPSVQDLKE